MHFSIIFSEILNGPILKSRVLTLSHVTKIDFLDFFRKFWRHIFSTAHDDWNDIYDDDVNRRICIVYEYIA